MTNQNKRVILVTGAGRGVGKGIAEGMAKRDIIICAARNQRKDQSSNSLALRLKAALMKRLKRLGKDANGIAYSIDLNSQILELSGYIKKEFGQLDLLVHSACQIHDDLVQPKPYWEKLDLWSLMDVGLKSNYFYRMH